MRSHAIRLKDRPEGKKIASTHAETSFASFKYDSRSTLTLDLLNIDSVYSIKMYIIFTLQTTILYAYEHLNILDYSWCLVIIKIKLE